MPCVPFVPFVPCVTYVHALIVAVAGAIAVARRNADALARDVGLSGIGLCMRVILRQSYCRQAYCKPAYCRQPYCRQPYCRQSYCAVIL